MGRHLTALLLSWNCLLLKKCYDFAVTEWGIDSWKSEAFLNGARIEDKETPILMLACSSKKLSVIVRSEVRMGS